MKKPMGVEAWGRDAARRRYADGGKVDVSVSEEGNETPISVSSEDTETPLEPQPANRSAEVDEFISRVMRDQIKKMDND